MKIITTIVALLVIGVTTSASGHVHDRGRDRGHHHECHHDEYVAVYEQVWVSGYYELVVCHRGAHYVYHPGYWRTVVRHVRR